MDINTTLLSTGTGGTLLMVLLYLYKSVVGKKIRSKCCDRDIEIGFSVEEMSPKTDTNLSRPQQIIQNPLHKSNEGEHIQINCRR